MKPHPANIQSNQSRARLRVFTPEASAIGQAREQAEATLPPALPPAAASIPVLWSRANTIIKWAALFGLNRRAMSRSLHDGEVRCERLGKRWRIALADCPAKVQLLEVGHFWSFLVISGHF